MKSKPNPFVRVSTAVAAITLAAIAQSAHAAALTWDSDLVTTGAQDGSGAWTTATGGWWNGSANVNWAATDTATFGAGTDAGSKAITLGGAITTAAGSSTTGGIHFANSGYTVSAASALAVTVGTTSNDGYLTVASGKSATIGANTTVQSASGRTMNISGGGTLYIQNGGTVRNPAAANNLFNIIGGTTVNVGTGGTLLAANNQLVIGSGAGGSGALVVDGGTVTNGTSGSTTASAAQNIVLCNSATGSTSGTLTINSGSVTNHGVGKASGGESGLRFGTSSAGGTPSAVVNLNGGTLTVARVYENSLASIDSTFNFNGGTLKVTTGAGNAANYLTGLDHAYVKEGGARIDTNGIATVIGQTLEHGGIAATDGGLTKSGSSALTLGSANSYTGITAINVGGLVASTNGALGTTESHTTVASGAALGFSGAYSNAEKIVGSGVGNTSAISGTFTAVQRGFVQSVSGSNSFAGNIEISATGISRIGTQDGASLTLTGSITRGSGVSGVSVLFRTGTSGDFVTLSNSGNNWDLDTVIFTGATSAAGGVRLGTDNALPTSTSVVAGGNSTGSGTTLDLNGFDQTLAGIVNSNGALHITNSNSANPSTLTLHTATADRSNFSLVGLTTIDDGAGQVALLKTGGFTQTLVGTHTYTGSTTVSAGTLLANGTLGDTDVTVNAGAFGGTGSLGGALDLVGGSFHVVDLTNPLDVTGTVSLYAGFGVDDLTGLNWGSVEDGSYTLINGTLGAGVFDALSNTSLATAYDLGGGRSAYFQNGSLDLLVVPEPAAATLLGLFGVLGLCRRRRCK